MLSLRALVLSVQWQNGSGL